MGEKWRKNGGKMEEKWRRNGGKMEEKWRKNGGEMGVGLGASQFCLKGEFTLAPPSLVGKGAGGLGLFAKLRCSRGFLLK
jgi:hypothetical protein